MRIGVWIGGGRFIVLFGVVLFLLGLWDMDYGITGWVGLGLFWISELVWVRVGIQSFSMLVSLEFFVFGLVVGI